MIQKRLIPQTLTLLGLASSVLIFTMVVLKLAQAQEAPAITISKEPDQMVVSNSTATFTITITNTGNVTLTNLTVSDPLASECSLGVGELPDLAPGISASYECIRTNVTSDFTNVATVTGASVPTGTLATDSDTAFVDVIHPAIEIAKTPDIQTVVSGTAATFTIVITNTGDVALTNVIVSDALVPNCNQTFAQLVPLQHQSYSCGTTGVTDSFTNSATATGAPPVGDDMTATDTAFVAVIHPAIEIAKTPDSQTIVSDSTVTFTITVTNTGDVPLTNVTVSDALAPNCATNIGTLTPTVSISYTCTLAHVLTGFTNSATVTGAPPLGDDVTATDTAFVAVIHPAIEIAKTPDLQTVASSSNANFTITITNTGDVTLANVTVSDALAPNCNRVFTGVLAGQHRTYNCQATNVTAGFINSATTIGATSSGHSVTAADAAKVRLDDTQTCPTDMAAYWKLDETSGTTYHDFYYGHNGQCAGQCPTPITGHLNGGQAFNGSNTGIDVPVVAGDDSFDWSQSDSFSIEFWMWTNSASTCAGNQVIVGRDDRSTELHWWSGCESGGAAAFYLRDTGGVIAGVTGATDLTDGDWHHIVATRDANANEIRIYVDGSMENSTPATYTSGFDSPTAALNIGWLNRSHGYHYEGFTDEVAVYNRALSADEIKQHHNEGLAGRWYCQGGIYAPIIVSTPLTEAIVGQLYIYDVEAVGNPVPTYTLTIHPIGMTIDPTTGVISWTPIVAQEGGHAVVVQATNSEGADTQGFTVTARPGTICPTDMIAYWKLNETSDTTYTDFYDGHDGGCAGACPTPATGYINGGQEFDGSSTGIDVPAHTDFDWGANDSFSIEFWMRTESASDCSGGQVIIGRDNDPINSLHWWVGCEAGGHAAFYLRETDGTLASAIGAIADLTDGSWHHVAAIRDANADIIRLYVDSQQEDSTPVNYNVGFNAPTVELNIGWLNRPVSHHFDGLADEIALYNRALTTQEIQQHFNNREGNPAYCINPDIAVVKTASPETPAAWQTVTYTYTVTNPGDAPLLAVGVSDDKCSPVTFNSGDNDSDNRLDLTETWLYGCSMALGADTTNTVIVTGTHYLNGTVNDADTLLVDVRDSSLTVRKEANHNLTAFGFTVTYGSSNESFQLKNGESAVLPDLLPGSYTITETVAVGWELRSITCTNGVSLIAPSPAAVTIDLQPQQNVICTFTNYTAKSLTIFLPLIVKY